jgi:hypothetical protein
MFGTEKKARRVIQDAIKTLGADQDGWWVLDSIEIRVRDGNTDLDVLVGIPNVGILIIEVKAWTEFHVTENGDWTYTNPDGRIVDVGDGPFKQAHREEYLLLKHLNTLRSQGALEAGPLPKIGSVVLFGNLDSTSAGLPDSYRREALFSDTLLPPAGPALESSRKMLNNLMVVLRERAMPDREMQNSVNRLTEIQKSLSPLCSVSGLRSFINESQIQLETLSETALGERALGYLGTRLYVEGAAGTGKTCFGLKLAVERSRSTTAPALYVCYSNQLANEIRATPWVYRENIKICTPEDLLVHLGQEHALASFVLDEEEANHSSIELAKITGITQERQHPRAYLESDEFAFALLSGFIQNELSFCAVIVDEAQDLSDTLITALESMVSADSLFAVFADPRQTTRRERAGLEWHTPSFASSADKQFLTRNYRNGDRIIDLVEDEFRIGYGRPPLGAAPAEVNWKSYSKASTIPDLVENTQRSLLDEGLSPTVIVTGVHSDELNELSRRGITWTEVDEFKGLERKSIILVIGPNPNPLDPQREDLYVGLTRATVHLTVLGPSS